ncbi:M23 family metallopeptidase [Actinomycetes bacterium KLBMP 9759]
MDDPDRTTPIRVVAKPAGATPPGVHRLPPPPAGTFRGRATVAAVAAGAVVAGGQTLASAYVEPAATASAMLPVASVSEDAEEAATLGVDAIGGDQLLPNTLAIRDLDAESQLDVQALAKATDIGQELARTASLIDAALAEGASEAHLFGDNVFVKPVLGRLTSMFGLRWGTSHRGIDIANSIGTPIYALTDGVVEEAGPATGFGLWVVLRHPDGTQSVYGHINRMFVKVGQKVKAGEQIAEVGNRGYSTGPHLHLEIWSQDGRKINPLPWLKRHGIAF